MNPDPISANCSPFNVDIRLEKYSKILWSVWGRWLLHIPVNSGTYERWPNSRDLPRTTLRQCV